MVAFSANRRRVFGHANYTPCAARCKRGPRTFFPRCGRGARTREAPSRASMRLAGVKGVMAAGPYSALMRSMASTVFSRLPKAVRRM